jgi:hypothetical protein
MAERAEADRLKDLWLSSARMEAPPAETGTAQALALGVNFRVDLVKAFKAAVETIQAAIKGTVAIHSLDPMTWAEAFIETYTASNPFSRPWSRSLSLSAMSPPPF